MIGLFYPFATVAAVFIISRWLQFEFKRPDVSFKKHMRWVIGALLLQIVAVIVSSVMDSKLGNFVLHSLGGGAAMTLVFVYLVKTFGLKLNWRLLTVALFGFVCAVGVINELGEFLGDLMGIAVFSKDAHDTWRDLFANTTGMVITWSLVLAFYARQRKAMSE